MHDISCVTSPLIRLVEHLHHSPWHAFEPARTLQMTTLVIATTVWVLHTTMQFSKIVSHGPRAACRRIFDREKQPYPVFASMKVKKTWLPCTAFLTWSAHLPLQLSLSLEHTHAETLHRDGRRRSWRVWRLLAQHQRFVDLEASGPRRDPAKKSSRRSCLWEPNKIEGGGWSIGTKKREVRSELAVQITPKFVGTEKDSSRTSKFVNESILLDRSCCDAFFLDKSCSEAC